MTSPQLTHPPAAKPCPPWEDAGTKPVIVLGVIGADCHAIGNQILALFFAEAGFRVVNLRVMVSQQEFIDAALKHSAQAILVSSLYGHAQQDCEGFRDLCTQNGLHGIVLYIGGNLAVGKTPFSKVTATFKAMGFDRVFQPDADLNQAASLLRQDVASPAKTSTFQRSKQCKQRK